MDSHIWSLEKGFGLWIGFI